MICKFFRMIKDQLLTIFFILKTFIVKRSRINSPLSLIGLNHIKIGSKVTIGYKSFLVCVPQTGEKKSSLLIEDGAVIGHFNHLYATKKIVIEKNALLADRVYISDCAHDYKNPYMPIKEQPIIQLQSVVIGENSFIGENVSIIGASVGKNSVIGANSVVTKNIPDYCVAVGCPAKVIKKFNFNKNIWESVDG